MAGVSAPTAGAEIPLLRSMDGEEGEAAISITAFRAFRKTGRTLDGGELGGDVYRICVGDNEHSSHNSAEEAAAEVGKLLPQAKRQDAQDAVAAHLKSPNSAKALEIKDDGLIYWSRCREMQNARDLGGLKDEIDGVAEHGIDDDRALVPLATFPIERWAMGGRVIRTLMGFADSYVDDLLWTMHDNAKTLRDKAAAIGGDESIAEAHDRFELGRRACAAALVANGEVGRKDAAAAIRPLKSEAGRELEATTFKGTAPERITGSIRHAGRILGTSVLALDAAKRGDAGRFRQRLNDTRDKQAER